MKDRAVKILRRLDLVKNLDPYNKKLLHDCFNLIMDMHDEIIRLETKNKKMLNNLENE